MIRREDQKKGEGREEEAGFGLADERERDSARSESHKLNLNRRREDDDMAVFHRRLPSFSFLLFSRFVNSKYSIPRLLLPPPPLKDNRIP